MRQALTTAIATALVAVAAGAGAETVVLGRTAPRLDVVVRAVDEAGDDTRASTVAWATAQHPPGTLVFVDSASWTWTTVSTATAAQTPLTVAGPTLAELLEEPGEFAVRERRPLGEVFAVYGSQGLHLRDVPIGARALAFLAITSTRYGGVPGSDCTGAECEPGDGEEVGDTGVGDVGDTGIGDVGDTDLADVRDTGIADVGDTAPDAPRDATDLGDADDVPSDPTDSPNGDDPSSDADESGGSDDGGGEDDGPGGSTRGRAGSAGCATAEAHGSGRHGTLWLSVVLLFGAFRARRRARVAIVHRVEPGAALACDRRGPAGSRRSRAA